MGCLWTESLPAIAALHILSYLDLSDFSSFGQVCSQWNSWLNLPNSWAEICRELDLEMPEEAQNYRKEVELWARQFGGFRQAYPRMRRLYRRMIAAIGAESPLSLACLKPPPAREVFDGFCTRLIASLKGFPEGTFTERTLFPPEVVCWYLMTDIDSMSDIPLFGELQCYNMETVVHPYSLGTLASIEDWSVSAAEQSILFGNSHLFLALADSHDGLVKKGNMWSPREGGKFVKADRFDLYLENQIRLVEQGILRSSSQGGLSRWPSAGIPEQTTREVKVTAGHVWDPKTGGPSGHLFMYHITMSMPGTATENASKLQTRHWKITDLAGETHVVNGPGVIGMHPVMRPGANFDYASCCPLPTPGGTMSGHFVMQDLVTGELWNLIVPTMNFRVAKTITEATLAANDLQLM